MASASLLRTSFAVTFCVLECATPTLGEVYSSRVGAAQLLVVVLFDVVVVVWLAHGCKGGAFSGK